jgi:hypothetical protein
MQERISFKLQPVKDNAALHGRDIGKLGVGTLIIVDEKLIHDGWVPIFGPGDLYPWKNTGKQAWVKLANTSLKNIKEHSYLLKTKEDGSIISFIQLS